MPNFDLVKMLRHITELQITKLFAVPPIFLMLSKHPLAKNADLSSLDMVGSGAAALAPETQRDVNRLLSGSDGATVKQGWGMTELTCTAMGWDPTSEALEGAGELMPGCKAKIVSMQSGEEIFEEEALGELYVAAPTLMRGYWRKPDATLRAITTDSTGTRWLRTGDIAYVSSSYEKGAIFHVVDRVKELIKVRGFQVSPTELGSLLLERGDIVDAAVVGVLQGGEEVPRAYVVCKPDSVGLSESEIEAWVGERVAPYKRLRGGLVFVDAIPKNPVSFTSIEYKGLKFNNDSLARFCAKYSRRELDERWKRHKQGFDLPRAISQTIDFNNLSTGSELCYATYLPCIILRFQLFAEPLGDSLVFCIDTFKSFVLVLGVGARAFSQGLEDPMAHQF